MNPVSEGVEATAATAGDALLRADTEELPRACGGVVGTARLRERPEDFQVVELPRVAPSGDGEHSWLYLRKRASNTAWVARQLARHAGVPLSAIGYAGLKDRNAVTEQWFSVHLPGRADPDWSQLDSEALQVLQVCRHSRKLKTGTLRGNRFHIRLRHAQVDADQLDQRLRCVRSRGFPNYFGAQRFGRDGGNLAAAAQLLFGERRRVPRQQRSLYLSAARSALFNRVLAVRVADDTWDRPLPGEVLQLAGRSACFVAQSVDAALLQRVETGEIHPTGPLCGSGDQLTLSEAAAIEQCALSGCERWIEALRRLRVDAARRPLRALPADLSWQVEGADWLLTFSLPAGAYATSLLAELVEQAPPR
jgi:tRNA pseudouridine13 synthase